MLEIDIDELGQELLHDFKRAVVGGVKRDCGTQTQAHSLQWMKDASAV